MPAPDGAATHLRSHDSPTRAGADAPSDAVPQRRAGRPYGAAHAGADTCACAGADAAPDLVARARTDASACAGANAAPDLVARARTDASASAGADAAPDLSAALSTADALAQPAADANPYA